MENEILFCEVRKKHRLEVKLSNSENLLVVEGSEVINMPEVIEDQFERECEFIIFGYLGVRRDLIEWYGIKEIN